MFAKVMAVTNQKGGAGKSSASVNLTIELAKQGKKVLLVDIDPQANATKVISNGNYNHEITTADVLAKSPPNITTTIKVSQFHENAHYIPASLNVIAALELLMTRSFRESVLKKQLDKLKSSYDIIIIDTQPNAQIGTINALVAANYFLIPIDGGFSLDGLSDLLMLVSEYKAGENYHNFIFRSNFNAANKVMARFINSALEDYKNNVLNSVIRTDQSIEHANTSAMPVSTYRPKSRAATDYAALATEITERMGLL